MTDKLSAFQLLVEVPESSEAQEAVEQFYADAGGDALVINKWFTMQAAAHVDDVLERVKKLMEHPDFTLKNPNRARSVLSVFAGNVIGFHKADGSGYTFLSGMVLKMDQLNPQVASRLALAFSTWVKLDDHRKSLIKHELNMLYSKEKELSKDTYEVVSKMYKAG